MNNETLFRNILENNLEKDHRIFELEQELEETEDSIVDVINKTYEANERAGRYELANTRLHYLQTRAKDIVRHAPSSICKTQLEELLEKVALVKKKIYCDKKNWREGNNG